MSYKVSAGDLKITLNDSDPVASVLQNVAVILSTRRLSAPLYRDFGLPMGFIDKPLPVAKTMAIAEIEEAVEAYEPRARIARITFDDSEPGQLTPIVEVEIDYEEP